MNQECFARTYAEKTERKRTMAIKIYIDQGHNPVNPNAGAEGNGLREQDIVYRIGQELAALLRSNGSFDVRLSRHSSAPQPQPALPCV